MAGGSPGIIGSLRILVDADTSKAQSTLRKLGGPSGLVGAAIGGAVGVGALQMLKLGDQWDAVGDNIRQKTGLIGAAFKDMENTVRTVGGNVSEDLNVVSDTLSLVYQRTGQTGAQLAKTGESIIDLARLTGTEYSKAADNVATIYEAWGVQAKDQIAVNDLFLRSYQATGTTLDTVTTGLAKNGATLRQLGFTIEESTALLSVLDKAGIEASTMMGAFRRSVSNLIKAGKDPAEAVRGIFDAIKAAPNDIKAGQMAIETFGAKGAVMAQLIREGKLDISALYDTIASGTDTVQKASDDTRDMSEGFKELKNRIVGMLGPVTETFAGMSEVFGNAIYLLPGITAGIGNAIGRMAPKVKGAMKGMWLKVMSSGAVQGAIGAAGALAGRVYAAAAAGAQALGSAISGMWAKTIGGTAAGAAAGKAASGLAASIGGVISGALAAVFSVGGAVAVALGAAIGLAIGSAIVGPEVAKSIAAMKEKVGGAVATMVTDEDFDRARAVVQKGIDDVNGAMFGLGGVMDFGAKAALEQQLADIDAAQAKVKAAVSDPLAIPAPVIKGGVGGDLAKKIRGAFHTATKAAMDGFGSVRDALQNPPKLRTKAWRMDHLAGQMKKVMANLRRAIKVGDPFAIQYWETARGKVARSQRRLKGTTVATMKDVKAEYAKTGTKVDGVWAGIKTTTDKKSQAASTKAVSEAQQTKAGIDAVDLRSSGIGLMGELAGGIYAGIPQVRAASYAAAAAAAGPLRAYSPPKEGPLSTIDKWGKGLVGAWAGGIESQMGRAGQVGARLAGAIEPGAAWAGAGRLRAGAAGADGGGTHYHIGTLVSTNSSMDALDRRLKGRQRMKRRDRRHVGSPNGAVR